MKKNLVKRYSKGERTPSPSNDKPMFQRSAWTQGKPSRGLKIFLIFSILFVYSAIVAAEWSWAENYRRIVVFQEGIPEITQEALVTATGSIILHRFSLLNALAIQIPSHLLEQTLATLLGNPQVAWIELDHYISVPAPGDDPANPLVIPATPEPVPGGYRWNLLQIYRDHVDTKLQGEGVRIAVLDTGIDSTHPALSQAVVKGYNARAGENSADWKDRNGHGTHIAGIIAGRPQKDAGIRGIASKANLYAVKVLDDNGGGYLSDLINGLLWVYQQPKITILKLVNGLYQKYQQPGINVINMSLGFSEGSRLLHQIIQMLHAQGVVLVASVGNTNGSGASGEGAAGEGAAGEGAAGEGAASTGCASGEGAAGEGAAGEGAASGEGCSTQELIKYPAKYPETIGVGAVDSNATIPPYSIRGEEVDLVAPGGTRQIPVFSTHITSAGGYGVSNGTSQAAAHVSGVVALLLQVNPQLHPEEIRTILQETAFDLGEDWEAQGSGLIDAAQAIEGTSGW